MLSPSSHQLSITTFSLVCYLILQARSGPSTTPTHSHLPCSFRSCAKRAVSLVLQLPSVVPVRDPRATTSRIHLLRATHAYKIVLGHLYRVQRSTLRRGCVV